MIPAIAPRQDRQCALCGVYESAMPDFQLHHWPPRSLGGTETVLLCAACHSKSEDGTHVVSFTGDWVYLLEGERIIQRRPRHYLNDIQIGNLLERLEQAPEDLLRIAAWFDKLPDDTVEPVALALLKLNTRNRQAIGSLLKVVKQRTPYGQVGEQFHKLSKMFDLGEREAYRIIEAVDFEQAHPELTSLSQVPLSVVLEAKKHANPAAVLETWEQLQESNGGGVRALRRALKEDDSVHQVQYHVVRCECGAVLNHARLDV